MTLRAEDIVAGYDGEPVLGKNGSGVSVTIGQGELLGIIGPNGSGKSTLLRVLARLLKPRRGRVTLDGRDLARQTPRRLARRLAVLPQSPSAPMGSTVFELVGFGRYPHVPWHRRLGTVDRGSIDRVIEACDLTHLADRPLGALSGGERQRAWIAMTLAQEPEILLLDEPITALDVQHQLDVLDLIAGLNREHGLTVAMVLHDLNLAARYCSRLVALRDGRIAHDGATRDVFRPDVLGEVFGVEARVGPDPVLGCPACWLYPTRERGAINGS